MSKFLGENGLIQVLQSINQRISSMIATDLTKVFKTDETWETATKAQLSTTNVNNYDVWYVTGEDCQYYWDSGSWIHFGPSLTNYVTNSALTTALSGYVPNTSISSTLNSVESGTKVLSQAAGNTLYQYIQTLNGKATVPAGGTTGQALTKSSNNDGALSWRTLIPAGGTAGQVLAKTDGTDYNSAWATKYFVPTGGTTGQLLTKSSSTAGAVGWADPDAAMTAAEINTILTGAGYSTV